jgi:uncharacterized RDD family membrane protein YckC
VERNRYAPPSADVDDVDAPHMEYVGFWARVGATLIDAVLLVAITYPILIAAYGLEYFSSSQPKFVEGPLDILVSWVFPFVAIVLFWHYKQATPGKMVIGARVVDATTGERLSIGRCITRYLGGIIATLPLGLGLLWVAFDPRKQGWHDKIAGTVVVVARKARAQVKDVSPKV